VAEALEGHHWLDTDGAAAFGEAFELLYGLGHRHIGLVTITEPMMFRRLREEGLGARGRGPRRPGVRLSTVATPRFDHAERAAALRALLARPDRPTALIALFDGLALAALEQAAMLGLAVPGALSVIGFDNVGAAEHARPALTTFDAAIHDAAREIADMLAALLAGPPRGRSPGSSPPAGARAAATGRRRRRREFWSESNNVQGDPT
jgi:LacI family transcriptional regulator